jgi:peptide/nickel transport system permease protein
MVLYRLRRRLPWLPLLAASVFTIVATGAIVAPYVSQEPLGRVSLSESFVPPIWAGGSWNHVFGTDQLGRDILGRLGYGARVSLVVAACAALAASLVGTLIGLVSGYVGGWFDLVVARIVEAQLSLPLILIALSVVIALGASLATIVFAIALSSWVPYARVVRSEVLVLKNSDFVALSVVTGLPTTTILRRHVLPNVLPSVVILASQNFGYAIIQESTLSYMSLGVQPPNVSWGLMIAQSRVYLASMPWLVLAPTFALAITALSANILGDFLRDRLDPTLMQVM